MGIQSANTVRIFQSRNQRTGMQSLQVAGPATQVLRVTCTFVQVLKKDGAVTAGLLWSRTWNSGRKSRKRAGGPRAVGPLAAQRAALVLACWSACELRHYCLFTCLGCVAPF